MPPFSLYSSSSSTGDSSFFSENSFDSLLISANHSLLNATTLYTQKIL
ncbi:hypothetical protein LINGRAHAP2_LOCUS2396 [Linum grandiflorum]